MTKKYQSCTGEIGEYCSKHGCTHRHTCKLCKKGTLVKTKTKFKGYDIDGCKCTNCGERFFSPEPVEKILQENKRAVASLRSADNVNQRSGSK